MKKLLISVLLITILLTAITSCNSADLPSSSDNTTTAGIQDDEPNSTRDTTLLSDSTIITTPNTTTGTTAGTTTGTIEDTTTGTPDSTDQVTDNEDKDTTPTMNDLDFSQAASLEGLKISETPTDYAVIEIEGRGSILIRLFPEVAPKTVENFKKLVSEKFYDGLIFHRVIENFMIQGGDPLGIGLGGADENIVGEFNSNGFTNNLQHIRGVISMARSSKDMDSASSQFFIMHRDYPSLDGDYASFGYVVYGMNVVDGIAKTTVDKYDTPMIDVVMTSIRFADVSQISFDVEPNIE